MTVSKTQETIRVPGFTFAGIPLANERKNLGLIFSEVPETVGAALFTRNDFKAAPVLLSQRLEAEDSVKRAIVVNSGNANAFTGQQGLARAEAVVQSLGQQLKLQDTACYIASTGVIGRQMDQDAIRDKLPDLVSSLGEDKFSDFAEAILTTDTRPKIEASCFKLGGKDVSLAGCIKGAGMIMPDLATMLCFVVTDASITDILLKKALRTAAGHTLNSITVDGDTSTNDSVFILSNGLAKNPCIEKENQDYFVFVSELEQLLEKLSKALISEAEGATKLLTIEVRKAKDAETARAVALSVANSPLVKTAFFGEQLNWGRLVMAVGKAQTGAEAALLDLYVNGVKIVEQGEPLDHTAGYREAEASLKKKDQHVHIDLNQGLNKHKVYTCDYSLEYVKINANYIS